MTKVCLLSIFIIGFVGIYDNCMNVIYSESLIIHEENPIGSFILTRNVSEDELSRQVVHGEVSAGIYNNLVNFVMYKALGTFLVIAACLVLCKTKYRSAIIVVAFLQACLFYYLSFYDVEDPHKLLKQEDTPIAKFVKLNTKYFTD